MSTVIMQVKVILPRKTQDAGWKTGKLWQKTVIASYGGEVQTIVTYYVNHPMGNGVKV